MNLNTLKILRFFHLINKRKYNEKRQIEIIKASGLFDPEWYLEQNPDVKAHNMDALKHYIKFGWREGRSPCAFLNQEEYLDKFPELAYKDITPLFHYILQQKGIKQKKEIRKIIFDILDKYTGKYKGKSADYKLIAQSKYFNKKWYLKQYPEVKEKGVDPIEHYRVCGWKKGYNPSPDFDGNFYLKTYLTPRSQSHNPLVHYLKYSHNKYIVPINYNFYKSGLLFKLNFFIKSLLGKAYLPKEHNNIKILVCLHLFYEKSIDNILMYLKNLQYYNTKLIVTLNNEIDFVGLSRIKESFSEVEFYQMPNNGFDVGPFIDILNKINLDDYDIVFKIHSKGVEKPFRFVYNQVFKYSDWFYNLMDGVLGGINCHKAITLLMNNKKVGMVAADNLIIQDPKHKQILTKQIAEKLGLDISEAYHYVAGTMFAAKAKCLKPIKNLGLTIEDFAETSRGEFSVAHAVERLICALVEKKGYKIVGLKTPHHQYKKEVKELTKTSSLRLLDDTRFDIDPDFFYKSLETRRVVSYAIHEIQLREINRKWIDGRIYKLEECSPFLYLKGDKAAYDNYCKVNGETSKFDMSRAKFDKLIASMEKGINPKMMPVIHGKDNILMDGQHRLCYLLNKYGKDYIVKCLHIYFNKDEVPATYKDIPPTLYDKIISRMKNKEPKISVIVFSHNNLASIEKILDSLMVQTYKNFEIRIIDNNSTKDTIKAIKKYIKQRPNTFLHRIKQRQKKLITPENVAFSLEKSEGEYIAIYNEQYKWHANYLEEMVKLSRTYANTNIITCDKYLLGEEQICQYYQSRIDKSKVIFKKLKNKISKKYFKKLIYTMDISCCLIKKDILDKLDYLNVRRCIDVENWLWRQICFKNKIYRLDKKLVTWYIPKMNEKNIFKKNYTG